MTPLQEVIAWVPALFSDLFEDSKASRTLPPKATLHDERKYDDSVAITEYIEFEGRPHFLGVPRWEEVADKVAEHDAQSRPTNGAG